MADSRCQLQPGHGLLTLDFPTMSNLNLHSITNDFAIVRLASLATWKGAAEFPDKDRGGPYVVIQEAYDPEDPKLTADEFVLGRSGKWLSIGFFYRMPVPERRAEFVFSTAAEVMEMMGKLGPKAQILRPEKPGTVEAAAEAEDEMVAAIRAGESPAPKS